MKGNDRMVRKLLTLLIGAFFAAATSTSPAQTASAQEEKTAAPRDVKVTSGPVVRSVSDTTAEITWSTNVNSNTLLHYGLNENDLSQTARAPWGGRIHRAVLSNLTPNTTYYFRVGTSLTQKTEPMTGTATFRTQPPKKAP
jgi:hypothetical protein